MTAAVRGDTVVLHYTGRLNDGTCFDSTYGLEPLHLTLGEGLFLQAFEDAILGLMEGGETTVTIPCADAYGAPDERLVQTIARSHLPPSLSPRLGQRLKAESADGEDLILTVRALETQTITLDANHPLCGEDLTFEITLVGIARAAA